MQDVYQRSVPTRLADARDRWIESLAGLAALTIQNYARDAAWFVEFVAMADHPAAHDAGAIDLALVQAYVDALVGAGLAKTTRTPRVYSLSRWLRFLHEAGAIDEVNPIALLRENVDASAQALGARLRVHFEGTQREPLVRGRAARKEWADATREKREIASREKRALAARDPEIRRKRAEVARLAREEAARVRAEVVRLAREEAAQVRAETRRKETPLVFENLVLAEEPRRQASGITTVAESVAIHRQTLIASSKAGNTINAYGSDLKGLIDFLHAKRPDVPEDVRLVDGGVLKSFLKYEADVRHIGSRSRARKLDAILSWFRRLRRRDLISAAQLQAAEDLPVPKYTKNIRPFPLPARAGELCDRAEADAKQSADPTTVARWALIELLYGSGVRISEALGLDLEHLKLGEKTALVTGKGSKERVVPLTGTSVRAIARWLAVRQLTVETLAADDPPKALFLTTCGRRRLARRQAWTMVAPYAQEVLGVRASPHALRHSCATALLDGGADLLSIRDTLGHASLSTTQGYTHLSLKHVKEVYAKAHPLAKAIAKPGPGAVANDPAPVVNNPPPAPLKPKPSFFIAFADDDDSSEPSALIDGEQAASA